MWEALCIAVWMLRRSETLGVRKRSEEAQTKAVKEHISSWIHKKRKKKKIEPAGMQRRTALSRRLELLFIDSNLVQTFWASVPGNPLFKSVWRRQEVIEMWFGRCRGNKNAEFSIYDKCGPLLCVYPFFSRALESVRAQCVFQRGCPRSQPRVPTPRTPSLLPPPRRHRPISHTSDSPPFLSSHLFIRAAACCFTGTSPCFVLFSPLFVFNCCGGGQLISLPAPPPPRRPLYLQPTQLRRAAFC